MSGNLLYWCSFLQAVAGIPFTNHDFIRWDQSIYVYVCSIFVQILYAVHLVVQSNHLTQKYGSMYIYIYTNCFAPIFRDFHQIRNITSRIVSTTKQQNFLAPKEEGLKIAESLTSKGPEHLDLSRNDLGLVALKAGVLRCWCFFWWGVGLVKHGKTVVV